MHLKTIVYKFEISAFKIFYLIFTITPSNHKNLSVLLYIVSVFVSPSDIQGWRQEFSDGGLSRPTKGLKYGFQGTINAKNLQKNRFPPSDGELACSDGGL